uniref:Enn protein n=1 Tax=Anopheles minimus TaxID=112268 RepID=A0A182VW34_9DIPT
MFTVVPSRFAGLKIEDDDDGFRKPKQKSKSTANTKPKSASVKSTSPQQQTSQQQTKKPKPKPQKNKPTNETLQKEQWSEWQQKDTELVEKSYVNDLEQALLLSKLDFEANKSKYNQLEKDSKQLAGKDKKPKALSLQEFQDKVSKELNERQQQKKRQQEEAEYNRNYTFFEQIDLETKQILSKEQLKMLFQQNRSMSSKAKESPKKDTSPAAEPSLSELDLLRVENLNLKEEITILRDRYKKVITMLKNGEMKEKTELMIEIEKLRKVQEDMTAEMTALYGQLEQAKSRTNQEAKGKERSTAR